MQEILTLTYCCICGSVYVILQSPKRSVMRKYILLFIAFLNALSIFGQGNDDGYKTFGLKYYRYFSDIPDMPFQYGQQIDIVSSGHSVGLSISSSPMERFGIASSIMFRRGRMCSAPNFYRNNPEGKVTSGDIRLGIFLGNNFIQASLYGKGSYGYYQWINSRYDWHTGWDVPVLQPIAPVHNFLFGGGLEIRIWMFRIGGEFSIPTLRTADTRLPTELTLNVGFEFDLRYFDWDEY